MKPKKIYFFESTILICIVISNMNLSDPGNAQESHQKSKSISKIKENTEEGLRDEEIQNREITEDGSNLNQNKTLIEEQVEYKITNKEESLKKEKEYRRKVLKTIEKHSPSNNNVNTDIQNQNSLIDTRNIHFSNEKIKIEISDLENDKVDYEIIQFEDSGLKILIDYTSNNEKNPKVLYFLRNLAIRNALGRISSFSSVKVSEKWGPFSKSELSKCSDKFVKVAPFYQDRVLGIFSL